MITLRPFKPSDTIDIIKLFRETVHSVGSRYYTQEQVEAWAPAGIEADIERWQKKLEDTITLVAEIDSGIIGFADMTRDGCLGHMYVRKEYQARGVGLKLFKELEKRARELGLAKITTHASVMAMPLAKRIGFVIVAEEVVVRKGVEIRRYAMEKFLK